MAIFLTFRLNTNDPAQIQFAEGLRKMISRVEVKVLQTPVQSQRNEGVSLMKAGQGSLAFGDTLDQLYELGYQLTKSYRNEGGDKITFVAEMTPEYDQATVELFHRLTAESGWTVRRYENPQGIAFSAMCPVDLMAQFVRATAKGKPFVVRQAIIA